VSQAPSQRTIDFSAETNRCTIYLEALISLADAVSQAPSSAPSVSQARSFQRTVGVSSAIDFVMQGYD